MSHPHRPEPPSPDPELARLATQGQQRRMQAEAEQRDEQAELGRRHLRIAIGAYRGSTLKRAALASVAAVVLVAASAAVLEAIGQVDTGSVLVPALFFVAFLLFMTWAFLPSYASERAIAAEQRWVNSLPFRLTGYFDVLSAWPQHSQSVEYQIQWQPETRPPDASHLHGAVCAVDPHARLDRVDGTGATITGGPVSGHTGRVVNRVPIHWNHRIPAHVHAVVEQVLGALHRSHPIAEVTLSRR